MRARSAHIGRASDSRCRQSTVYLPTCLLELRFPVQVRELQDWQVIYCCKEPQAAQLSMRTYVVSALLSWRLYLGSMQSLCTRWVASLEFTWAQISARSSTGVCCSALYNGVRRPKRATTRFRTSPFIQRSGWVAGQAQPLVQAPRPRTFLAAPASLLPSDSLAGPNLRSAQNVALTSK